MKQFETTHPTTGDDIRILVDEDHRLQEAYYDDGTEVDIQEPAIKDVLQAAVREYYSTE